MADERILIVDDEEGLRRVLSILLTKEGYDVTGARSAAEALELGLVHRLYPADRFGKEVEAFATDLAARAPIALAAAKRAVQHGSPGQPGP